jgi:hypothetical protein
MSLGYMLVWPLHLLPSGCNLQQIWSHHAWSLCIWAIQQNALPSLWMMVMQDEDRAVAIAVLCIDPPSSDVYVIGSEGCNCCCCRCPTPGACLIAVACQPLAHGVIVCMEQGVCVAATSSRACISGMFRLCMCVFVRMVVCSGCPWALLRRTPLYAAHGQGLACPLQQQQQQQQQCVLAIVAGEAMASVGVSTLASLLQEVRRPGGLRAHVDGEGGLGACAGGGDFVLGLQHQQSVGEHTAAAAALSRCW